MGPYMGVLLVAVGSSLEFKMVLIANHVVPASHPLPLAGSRCLTRHRNIAWSGTYVFLDLEARRSKHVLLNPFPPATLRSSKLIALICSFHLPRRHQRILSFTFHSPICPAIPKH